MKDVQVLGLANNKPQEHTLSSGQKTALSTSKTSIFIYQATECHIPEDSNLNIHSWETRMSYIYTRDILLRIHLK